MELQDFGLDGRKAYFIVLIVGMVSSVAIFSAGYEAVSAGVIIAAVLMLVLIKSKSDRPVFDERDNSLAEESSHTALMLSGAFLGVVMIFISFGMGLNYFEYPDWIAPYYLSWGLIISLSVVIEVLKRYGIMESGKT